MLPQADSCIATKIVLFDHLVGACEERGRHGQAKRLGGLEIDHEFEFGGLLDRKIGGLCPLEDLIDILRSTAEGICEAGPVGDEAAGLGIGPSR